MKALVYYGTRDIRLNEIPTPTLRGSDDVCIRVRAAAICGSDVSGYKGTSKFRVPPLIMGHEFAGEVVALGTEVKQVAVGQRVAVNPNLNCGKCRSCLTGKSNLCQSRKIVGTAMRAGKYDGGMAEYVCVPSRAVLPIPDEVSFDEAALLEPLAVAMHAVKQSEHVKNEVVAVVGVGPIGLLAVQCAKSAGARTVVAVDINEDRLAIARQLRADIAITNTTDYRVAMGNINEVGTATVIDAVGTAESLEHSVQMVRDGGDIVVVGLGGRNLSVDTYELVTREIVIRGSHIYRNEMEEGLAAIASGAINLHALITSVWPLEKGPDVFAELASGQTKDVKVVLHPA